jgi:broad specificity phosphatase PhoE
VEGSFEQRILFLFRHGETDWLGQARLLGEKLRPHRLETVVSSDLARALTTGKIVADALGISLWTDHGLRETNVGAAEGLLWAEAKSRFGEGLAERWYSDEDTAFPGGETGLATRTRGLAALRRFALAHPYRRIGVSTHGAMVRQLMKHALPPGSPPATARNTVLYILKYEPAGGRLVLADDEIDEIGTADRPGVSFRNSSSSK